MQTNYDKAMLHESPKGALGAGVTAATSLGKRSQRGQSMVELALFLPVLVLLLCIAVDFGRIMTTTISLSNAAKLAALYASADYDPNHGASTGCLTSPVQSLIAPEFTSWSPLTPTVSLTTAAYSTGTAAYTGEQTMSATLSMTFTFITPVLNAVKSMVLFQTAADPLQSLPVATSTSDSWAVAPLEPGFASVTVLHDQQGDPISDPGDYWDEIDWTPATSPTSVVTQTFTPPSGTAVTSTGHYVIFQSDPNATTPAPNGCPVAYPTMTGASTYSWDVPVATLGNNYTYWIGVIAPYPAAYTDASITNITKAS